MESYLMVFYDLNDFILQLLVFFDKSYLLLSHILHYFINIYSFLVSKTLGFLKLLDFFCTLNNKMTVFYIQDFKLLLINLLRLITSSMPAFFLLLSD